MKSIYLAGLMIALAVVTSCDQVDELIARKPELKGAVEVNMDVVSPLDTVTASIEATNPEDGPLFYEWHSSGGFFIKPADTDTVFWVAPVEGGTYEIWVKVSNNKRSITSKEKKIEVITPQEPLVSILEPEAGHYYVLGQSVDVEAWASHPNGILSVKMYVNDALIAEKAGSVTGNYRFSFATADDMVGICKITIEAFPVTQLAGPGRASVTIQVGGIITGKYAE